MQLAFLNSKATWPHGPGSCDLQAGQNQLSQTGSYKQAPTSSNASTRAAEPMLEACCFGVLIHSVKTNNLSIKSSLHLSIPWAQTRRGLRWRTTQKVKTPICCRVATLRPCFDHGNNNSFCRLNTACNLRFASSYHCQAMLLLSRLELHLFLDQHDCTILSSANLQQLPRLKAPRNMRTKPVSSKQNAYRHSDTSGHNTLSVYCEGENIEGSIRVRRMRRI